LAINPALAMRPGHIKKCNEFMKVGGVIEERGIKDRPKKTAIAARPSSASPNAPAALPVAAGGASSSSSTATGTKAAPAKRPAASPTPKKKQRGAARLEEMD
jgi:hypothetical protein